MTPLLGSAPPRVKPYPNETAFALAARKRIVSAWGGYAIKIHGNSFQQPGTPDLLGVLQGRSIAIELKQPGNTPTTNQQSQMRRWASRGALVGWCRTEVELDELLSHVDDPGWHNPQLDVDY